MSTRPNLPRDAALAYAESGLTPVPLKPRTKKPSGGLGWQTKTSRDPARIRRRFRPASNVGLQMGQIDDRDRQLFCVDVDVKNGADLRRFVAGRAWPVTTYAQTCSNGSHHLFWSAPGTRVYDSNHALGRGLDLKGLMGPGDYGGQIVVEPSVYTDPKTGKTGHYLWIVQPTSLDRIAQAPGWLMDAIRKHQGAARTDSNRRPGEGPRRADEAPPPRATAPAARGPARPSPAPPRPVGGDLLADAIARFPVAPDAKGDRNAQMLKLCTSLVCRGADDVTAERALTDWWEHFYSRGDYHSPPNSSAIRAQVAYARRSLEVGKITPCQGKPDVSRPAFNLGGLDAGQVAGLLFTPAQREPVEHLILNVPSGGRRVADLCMLKCLLILLAEDRAGGPDGLLRTTHREMVEVLRGSFGLEVPLNSFSRLFGRWRVRSDRSGVPGFEGQGAGIQAAHHVLEEVEVGRMTAGGYVPSVYRPLPALERLLAMEAGTDGALPAADEALPATDEAPATATPAPGPSEDGSPDEGRTEPRVTEETEMPAPGRLKIAKQESPAREVLAFPTFGGLVEILSALKNSKKFSDAEWAEAQRFLQSVTHPRDVGAGQWP
jgi:hypothetical protein